MRSDLKSYLDFQLYIKNKKSFSRQLFEIYDMLPNASLEKMNTVTKNAVTICTVVYALVGVFGYVAFYNQSILGN